VLFHTGFIVVATLVVNGSTTGMILHALGLDKAGINKTAVVESLQTAMGERTMKIYLENFYDETLGGADFDLVKEYVTSLRLMDEKRNQPVRKDVNKSALHQRCCSVSLSETFKLEVKVGSSKSKVERSEV
jgi:hypothetical protein